ncbi:MAG: NAD(P)-dependent oxidoreductase [Proteobacteria bacterium]|nr:NAD(P)-dependent oxidoreductase [Pseudomonadota bacterium]HQR04003.1 NAD(P)-dependent oxidoreductase [Rhodocyclaceae bacterium]
MASRPLLSEDVDHILGHTGPLWRELDGERLFITGGTGFFGKWMLESLINANRRLDLDIRATVLSRDPQAFERDMPHLAGNPAITWLRGDVRDFKFPAGEFSHVLHMATAASAALNDTAPLEMLATIVDGTRHTLEFAEQAHCERLLFTSSGAVYGPQPEKLERIPEDYRGGPDPTDPRAAYAEGKRMAEMLCTLGPVPCVIARCFAFIGPHLPLDAHFAAGNFLRDALAGGPIALTGDGRSVRSYLYGADLVCWLLHLLIRGTPDHPYNVGSPHATTTLQLAEAIAMQLSPQPRVSVLATSPVPSTRYVPCTNAIHRELALTQRVDLPAAIRKTLKWHREIQTPRIP